MPKLIVFNQVALDGYFTGPNGDISWAHKNSDDAEWNEFVAKNAGGGGVLLLGRITYDLMVSYWPTSAALKNSPEIAEHMNNLRKVVVSRTLEKPAWNNTTLIKDDLAVEVRKMKKEPGPGIAILGSGSLVSQLAQEGLIDEYQMVLNPIVLGSGRTLFDGLKTKLPLKQTRTRIFANGNVLLCYEPLQ